MPTLNCIPVKLVDVTNKVWLTVIDGFPQKSYCVLNELTRLANSTCESRASNFLRVRGSERGGRLRANGARPVPQYPLTKKEPQTAGSTSIRPHPLAKS